MRSTWVDTSLTAWTAHSRALSTIVSHGHIFEKLAGITPLAVGSKLHPSKKEKELIEDLIFEVEDLQTSSTHLDNYEEDADTEMSNDAEQIDGQYRATLSHLRTLAGHV